MNSAKTKSPDKPEEEAPEAIPFREFLENVPPGHARFVEGYYTEKNGSYRVAMPRLWLHCSSDVCNGERYFDPTLSSPYLKITETSDHFLSYICPNCRRQFKRYSLLINAYGIHRPGKITKYGEVPPFGPPVPNRLLRLLEDSGDKELFLKGRQCENQGLGVGAFSYYRRVVENKKAALISEIIKVAETINAPKETMDALSAAREDNQFKSSVELIKDAIPESLLINGHNPMTLLYAALSEGLHDRDDDHCLELAMSIRVVLSDLVQKVSDARKENADLHAAIAKLTQNKKGK